MSTYLFQGNDAFTVDVSNGFTTVENLQISVNVVPRLIPIQIFNFTVKEGLGKVINADIVNISHPFYSAVSIDFLVEDPPQHGEIRYLEGDELTYFTWNEVRSNIIEDIQIHISPSPYSNIVIFCFSPVFTSFTEIQRLFNQQKIAQQYAVCNALCYYYWID